MPAPGLPELVSTEGVPSDLSDSEGDAADKIASETVLQAVEDFLTAVANDFAEPHTAVDVHEERAPTDASWLRVSDDIRVEQVVPDFHYFSFRATAIHAQVLEYARQDGASGLGAGSLGTFQRGKVNAAPLGKDALPRG